jgi:hypothetical protein
VPEPRPRASATQGGTISSDERWPVLSIRHPWSWAIMHGGKDVENRGARTNYRGRIWIHVPVTIEPIDMSRYTSARPPVDALVATRTIIGSVEIVNAVRDYQSPWAVPGRWHWVLRDPVALTTTVPCRGMPGLFWPDEEMYERLAAAA